jgi:hypothetical protein
MALERMIEQARIEEINRQKRIEAERRAIQEAEIEAVRVSLQNVMKKYDLTQEQVLSGSVQLIVESKALLKGAMTKKPTLQEMRMFYSNL